MPSRNVLLIVADDLGRNLGCYGEKVVQTPNIDALASSGVKFDMAFASTASCSGSRSVIYSGLHTHQNGQYGLQHTFHHFMTHDHVETLPALFNAAGYTTGIINKIHVGPEAVYPWSERHESPTRDVAWVAETARGFLTRAKEANQGFALTIGYMDPHRDSTRGGFANKPDKDGYPGVKDVQYNPKELEVPFYLTDLPAVRQELAEYYRAISRLDQGVGMVLHDLEELGLKDNTLVVFVSDNGPPFLNSKTTLYDAGVRLPLIVRQPGGPCAVTNDTLVSFVDILPTLLDYAGVSPPPNPSAPQRRGRSLLPMLSQFHSPSTAVAAGPSLVPEAVSQDLRCTEGESWTEVYGSHTFHELTNYYPTRFIRTRQFKYHRNICWKLDFPFSADIYASKSWEAIRNAPRSSSGAEQSHMDRQGEGKGEQGEIMIGKRTLSAYVRRGPEELYDMLADPEEVNNLVSQSEYAEVIRHLRRKVEAWQRETEDPWLFRDGVSLRSMAQYIGEDGWKIQERFDFELDNPCSNDGVPQTDRYTM